MSGRGKGGKRKGKGILIRGKGIFEDHPPTEDEEEEEEQERAIPKPKQPKWAEKGYKSRHFYRIVKITDKSQEEIRDLKKQIGVLENINLQLRQLNVSLEAQVKEKEERLHASQDLVLQWQTFWASHVCHSTIQEPQGGDKFNNITADLQLVHEEHQQHH
jgi:hypothetical protein